MELVLKATNKFVLAKRIYDMFIFEMRDADKTIDDIISDIDNNPREVIKFLLDSIDER